jgi:Ca-activated chloride channel homolog
MDRRFFSAAVLPAFLLALAVPACLEADGFIYVPGPPRPIPPHPQPVVRFVRPEFPLQVVKHRVETRIDDSVARTRVEETFYNPNGSQLEGTYMFPLPPGASISRFAMMVGGKEIAGEVLDRDKARGIYESIVRQSRDPGLLEFIDRGLFRARVFPIPALGNVEVRVEYDETLPSTGGLGRYRYPLNTGKYSAGDYKEVLIDVTLHTSAPLRSVNCSSHPASVSRPGDHEARIVFEARTLTAEKDFTIDWNVGEDALAPALLVQRTHEPEGFFYLTISPRPEKPKAPPPKDLVAVIDTSGSMLGPKMDEAQKALRHFVNGLNPADRFGIVDFSTEARRFREGLTEANEENRRLAQAYIDGLQARGGTNIEEALRVALATFPSGGDDRLKLVVLITDGEPTVGLTRPEDILRSVREKNNLNRRLFAFGVGVDLNAQLLERLVQENRGSLDYVLPGENLEVKLSSFWDKIDFPVFTEIRLEFPNFAVSDVYPKPLPDLFRGESLAVAGRFRDGGRHAVVLRGRFLGEEKVFEYSLDFSPPPAAGGASDSIARLWATRKIGYLLESMRLSGNESREVKDEVVRLSQQYGILTPYTSYLILEEGQRYAMPDGRGGSLGPVAAAAPRRAASDALSRNKDGIEREEIRASAQEAKRDFSAASGAAGVSGGRAVQGLKEGAPSPKIFRYPPASEAGRSTDKLKEDLDFYQVINRDGKRVQQVGSRAFYLQGERWVEGGLTEKDLGSIRKVAYLSDEYFDLLTKHPGIGELLGVGEKVTFRWNGETIAVE